MEIEKFDKYLRFISKTVKKQEPCKECLHKIHNPYKKKPLKLRQKPKNVMEISRLAWLSSKNFEEFAFMIGQVKTDKEGNIKIGYLATKLDAHFGAVYGGKPLKIRQKKSKRRAINHLFRSPVNSITSYGR